MSWRDEAECRKASDNSWFPVGNSGRQSRVRKEAVARAVSICRRCPVRAACANDALKRNVSFGIWAGIDLGDNAHKALPASKEAELERVAKGMR